MILRKATTTDAIAIWEILQQAISQRKLEGSDQWQDGYPNPEVVANDITHGYGYVVEENNQLLGYTAVIFDGEPAYEAIEGKWLSDGDYAVVHRVAVASLAKGKGVATQLFDMIADLARQQRVYSIKVDTNFDNLAMLKIMSKLGYTYCGEVIIRDRPRKAFEKLLS